MPEGERGGQGLGWLCIAFEFENNADILLTTKYPYIFAMYVYSYILKDTGTKNQTPLSFVMLNYFRTNQYQEP